MKVRQVAVIDTVSSRLSIGPWDQHACVKSDS